MARYVHMESLHAIQTGFLALASNVRVQLCEFNLYPLLPLLLLSVLFVLLVVLLLLRLLLLLLLLLLHQEALGCMFLSWCLSRIRRLPWSSSCKICALEGKEWRGWFSWRIYLEGQGNLVSKLVTLITHMITLVILVFDLLT